MLTIKTSLAVAIVAGVIAVSSAITYTVFTVMHLSEVNCETPVKARPKAAPAPQIRTDDGQRF